MRVTAQAKEATRSRIVDAAHKLFQDKGFEQTTTRDIAAAADIATGTLFNYFPTKETLAITMIAAAIEKAEQDFRERAAEIDSLEEAVFAYVALGLRRLRPHRHYLGHVLDSALTPFGTSNEAAAIRTQHLEVVRELAASKGARLNAASPVVMHLYWAMYLGVLAFWVKDRSPKQEATLALLDHAVRLFVSSLAMASSKGGPALLEPQKLSECCHAQEEQQTQESV